MKFICKPVALTVETTSSDFTNAYTKGQTVTYPVAHHDGNYIASPDTLAALNEDDRVAFRYRDDINGSAQNIAGILSENRRVLGLMPHPERAADPVLGGKDGADLFRSLAIAAVTA